MAVPASAAPVVRAPRVETPRVCPPRACRERAVRRRCVIDAGLQPGRDRRGCCAGAERRGVTTASRPPRRRRPGPYGPGLLTGGPSGRLVETCPCAGSYGAAAPSDPRPRGTCHPSASGAGQHATQSHRRGARSCGSALPRWRDSSRDRHRCRSQSSRTGGIAPGARRPHTAGDPFRCRGARHGSALCERRVARVKPLVVV